MENVWCNRNSSTRIITMDDFRSYNKSTLYFFIVALLFFLVAWVDLAIPAGNSIAIISSTGGSVGSGGDGGGDSSVLDEAFDGSNNGFDTSGWSVTDGDGTPANDIDQDNATHYVSSPHSCLIDVNDSTAAAHAGISITAQSSTHYYRVKFRIISGSIGSTFAYLRVFSGHAGSDPDAGRGPAISVGQAGAGTYRVYCYDNSNSQYAAANADTWYTVYIKYYSDGSTATEWYLDSNSQTAVTAGTDRDVDNVFVGASSNGFPTTGEIEIDDVKVSPVAADVGWPG